MDLISPILLVGSLVLFAHALFSLYLLLYSWEHPERLEASHGPRDYSAPKVGFTLLLPARDEARVIGATIRRLWAADYPRRLLQILVICHASDRSTIEAAQAVIDGIGSRRVRLVTFGGEPVNKPRALNVGLSLARHQVIGVFDAEDDVDPQLFNMVNTVMVQEGAPIVQAGVQLMNFRDHWWSVHNCLEYFFWFKSRLHFHAKIGMIPLGGNTVFIKRSLVRRVGGWDEDCLTEDADIGLRLSVLGEPIRVVYDAQRVTREETPKDVPELIRQRTRWNQGFMHVLRKGSWLTLPRWQQRALAVYTFSYPLIQGPITLIWPLAIVAGLVLKVPVPIAMASFLPLYAMVFQMVLMVVGAFMFAREYGVRIPLTAPLTIMATFLPYQWILGYSAVRAAYRELQHESAWEKTDHLGAHRLPLGSRRRWRPAAAIPRTLRGAARADAWRSVVSSIVAVVRAAVGEVRPIPEPPTPAPVARSAVADAIRATIATPLRPDVGPVPYRAGSMLAVAPAGQPSGASRPLACSACDWKPSSWARFCRRCGSPLDLVLTPIPVAPRRLATRHYTRRAAVAGLLLGALMAVGPLQIILAQVTAPARVVETSDPDSPR